MKAFWWFKKNSIAGMARPGFNHVQWMDLPFEETLIYGWLGQKNCGTQTIQSLKKHFAEYGSKIREYHKVGEVELKRICDDYEKPAKISEIFQRVADRTKCIERFEVNGEHISFSLNKSRLKEEFDFFKANQIATIVTLTENHNQHEELGRNFEAHHLSIEDLNAPKLEQAQELAKIIEEARSKNKRLAVHCMAGIGRTSTMLIAAHLLLGEKLESLLEQVGKANPVFGLTGRQAEFVRSVANSGRN